MYHFWPKCYHHAIQYLHHAVQVPQLIQHHLDFTEVKEYTSYMYRMFELRMILY